MNSLQDSLAESGERVKDVRRALELSQKDFAAQLNIAPSFLSEIESGKTRAGYNFLIKMAGVFDVNPSWIILGKGEMFFKDEGGASIWNNDFGEHTESIKELLWYFKHSPLVRLSVMAFASKFLLDNEEIIKRDIKKNEQKKEQ